MQTSGLDVAIVGAGAAGIGMAATLSVLDDLNYAVFEADTVGASFRRWPKQTRFITPSFYSTPFRLPDLNSVDGHSSPALFSGSEHLSGPQYADYLYQFARQNLLPVSEHCSIRDVEAIGDEGFLLNSSAGTIKTRFLIWATGEFQFPDLMPFPGAQYCRHYAEVADWADFTAPRYTVIGGYESAIDAAICLVSQGAQVRLLAKHPICDTPSNGDPSRSLSPHSRDRLAEVMPSGRLELISNAEILQVTREGERHYRAHAGDGRSWLCEQPPILATGFKQGGGAKQIEKLWDWSPEGEVKLTEFDESTRTPGLFLIGPQVRHPPTIYCFIYKFRQRFPLIATYIAAYLGLDTEPLEVREYSNSYSDDPSCCGEPCQC